VFVRALEKEFDSIMVANADTVLQAVAANPGTSAGLSLAEIRSIFAGLCSHLEAMLERRRSIVVPGFCHFVVQKHVGHSGTWGARVTWVPVMMLVPQFCQAFSVLPNTQTSLTHQGATTPATINSTAVVACCSGTVSRYAILNVVKDIVRELGGLVGLSSQPLTLDMKFCTITFSGRRVTNVSWAPSFLRVLNSDAQVDERTQAGLSVTQGVIRTASAERPPSARDNHTVPSKLFPRPPTTPIREQDRSTPLVPASAGQAHEASKSVPVVPAPPPRGLYAFGSRPSTATFPSASGTFGGMPAALSPRRAAQDASLHAHLDAIASTDEASPHTKRTARKLAYRRSRNQAYEDSWQNNLDEKRLAAEAEAEADRQAAAAVLRKQVEDAEKTRQEKVERRDESDRIEKVNQDLVRMRQGHNIPRAHPPADIFDARRSTAKVPHDVSALHRQVAERRAREAADKAEAAAYGEAAWREHLEQKVDEQRKKQQRRDEREKEAKEHDRIIAEKRLRLRSEAAADLELARKCEGFAGFGLGGDAFRQQSIAIQKANYEMVMQRATERQRKEDDEKAKLADSIRRIEARDAALRDQEKRAKTARQSHLRSTWSSQMSQRHTREHGETMDRKTWKDVNFLRNESSDDEDEATRAVKIPNHRQVAAAYLTSPRSTRFGATNTFS
jgi:hypothetical protein